MAYVIFCKKTWKFFLEFFLVHTVKFRFQRNWQLFVCILRDQISRSWTIRIAPNFTQRKETYWSISCLKISWIEEKNFSNPKSLIRNNLEQNFLQSKSTQYMEDTMEHGEYAGKIWDRLDNATTTVRKRKSRGSHGHSSYV